MWKKKKKQKSNVDHNEYTYVYFKINYTLSHFLDNSISYVYVQFLYNNEDLNPSHKNRLHKEMAEFKLNSTCVVTGLHVFHFRNSPSVVENLISIILKTVEIIFCSF